MANDADVVLQIVPRVSDALDGVTDYALNLGKALLAHYRLRSVFAPIEPSQLSGKDEFRIAPIAGAGVSPDKPAHLILHYVNYGYQKRGLPFSLLPILRALRESCRGRLLVIFHELFASGPPWKSEFWLQPLQKKIARDVARLADARLVSSESMRQSLEKLAPGLDAVVHPVPSAFGEPVIDPAELRERDNHRWLICGGTELVERSLRSFLRVVGTIPASVAPRNLAVVGGRENSRVRQMLKTLADIHCEYQPAVSPEKASQILSTCAFAWLDYFTTGPRPDLLLKSSSFANVCAHAVVCVTPHAMAAISRHGDSLPGPFTIAPDNVKLPSPSERPDVARHIYDWYHRHAAGRTLVQMVAKALRVS
ncbi:MAG: hypothetical protein DME46_10280 [Verrucomicrobia bacterium]|nr:MAG: hypothetical protein DME46_10280 [Verrucomicrobiota bacterium]